MPGLIACNRRWEIGSDDLLIPAIVETSFRLIWLTVTTVIFAEHGEIFSTCSGGNLMQMFYIGRITIISLHISCNIAIIYISTQGAIMDVARRKRMPAFLYIKLAIFMPEIAWIILGTYWAFFKHFSCPDYIVITAKVAVCCGWAMIFFVIIGIFVVFDPLGSRSAGQTLEARPKPEDYPTQTSLKKIWEIRCRLLCCCAMGDENSKNAFDDVAQLLGDFFEGLDLVPTDIAAGLVLYQSEQRQQPRRSLLKPVLSFETYSNNALPVPVSNGETSRDLAVASPADVQPDVVDAAIGQPHISRAASFPSPKGWMDIYNSAYFMKFALASYTWPLYIYMNPVCGCCRLSRDCSCCQCSNHGTIHEDNCCHCNLTAIQMITGTDLEDIVYASFYNRIYEIPFYVVVDHNKSAIIIAIRGTLSLRDALTDMTAESEEFEVEGVGTVQAHKGILNAAKYIKDTLAEKEILRKAFDKGPGYRLVIAGHSLGAGASALLAVLLKPTYPDLNCFAFSPPGGLISMNLSRHTEDFVLSVVVGEDLVPRLGIVTMDDLRVKILRVIRDANKPKYRILAGGVMQAICGCGEVETGDAASRRHLLAEGGRSPSYTVDMPGSDGTQEEMETGNYEPTRSEDGSYSEGDGVQRTNPDGSAKDKQGEAKVASREHANVHPVMVSDWHEEVCAASELDKGGNDPVSIPCEPVSKCEGRAGVETATHDSHSGNAPGEHGEFPSEHVECPDPLLQIPAVVRALDDAIMTSSRSRMINPPLYPPGHIIYIEEATPAKGCFGEPTYKAAWARAETFDEIIVSPKMVTDHLPDVVIQALEQLADQNYIPNQVVEIQPANSA